MSRQVAAASFCYMLRRNPRIPDQGREPSYSVTRETIPHDLDVCLRSRRSRVIPEHCPRRMFSAAFFSFVEPTFEPVQNGTGCLILPVSRHGEQDRFEISLYGLSSSSTASCCCRAPRRTPPTRTEVFDIHRAGSNSLRTPGPEKALARLAALPGGLGVVPEHWPRRRALARGDCRDRVPGPGGRSGTESVGQRGALAIAESGHGLRVCDPTVCEGPIPLGRPDARHG